MINISSGMLLYIDPSAVSILLSSLTAIIVGISASLIIFFRKFKKKVNKKLHIDENAKKEKEEDIVVIDNEINEELKNETQVLDESYQEENTKQETAEIEKEQATLKEIE